ncbi:hypothetical protein chiPu_0024300, partial [Chiloscyllium punctatum]|nr:hypothetical protein [Chiloscyllium punctatum]
MFMTAMVGFRMKTHLKRFCDKFLQTVKVSGMAKPDTTSLTTQSLHGVSVGSEPTTLVLLAPRPYQLSKPIDASGVPQADANIAGAHNHGG